MIPGTKILSTNHGSTNDGYDMYLEEGYFLYQSPLMGFKYFLFDFGIYFLPPTLYKEIS